MEYAGSGTASALMLRNAPRLMAGYLAWLNRWRDNPRRHLLLAAALVTAEWLQQEIAELRLKGTGFEAALAQSMPQ